MRRLLTAALVVASFALGGAARAERVGIVAAGPEDEAAARHLSRQLASGGTVRRTTRAHDPEALLARERREWHDDLVVVLDARRASVFVLRPRDGAILSRALDEATAETSPYSMAVAAGELLDLARVEQPPESPGSPAARPEPPAPLRPEPVAQVPAEPPRDLAPRDDYVLDYALGLGVREAKALDGDLSLIEPTLSAALEIGRRHASSWVTTGVAGSTFGHDVRAFPLVSGKIDRITYDRSEIALLLGVGESSGRAVLGAWYGLGVALAHLRAADSTAAAMADDSRQALVQGLGGEVGYDLGWGGGIGAGMGVAWVTNPSHFRVESVEVLREGQIELRAQAGFLWRTRFRH